MRLADEVGDELRHRVLKAGLEAEVQERGGCDAALLTRDSIAPVLADVAPTVPKSSTSDDPTLFLNYVVVLPSVDVLAVHWPGTPRSVIEL
jgi:hypothetical protein